MKTDQPILQSLNPELLRDLGSRRDALGKVLKLSTVALTAPLLLATLASEAHGRTIAGEVVGVLRFALLLERLEAEFYKIGLQTNGLIPEAHRRVFETIHRHEAEHVALLAAATGRLVNNDRFDFTAGGRHPDVFSSYRTFLAIGQSFEDTGVRAYKGQAPMLMPVPALLSIALRIHSVEGRHASQVRRMRGQKGWITGSSRGSLPADAQGTYNGEGQTNEGGIRLAGIGATASSAASEAFDEPLTKGQVLAIVRPFVVNSSVLEG